MAAEKSLIRDEEIPGYVKKALQDWIDGIKGRRFYHRNTGDEISGYEKSDTGTLWQLFDDNLILLDKKIRLLQDKYHLSEAIDGEFENIFSNLYTLSYELKYRKED